MINRDYRGKDMPTDVISFALEDEGEDELPIIFDDEELAELPRNLGDLIISTERAAEQAVEYGHTLEREMGFWQYMAFYIWMGTIIWNLKMKKKCLVYRKRF